MKDKSKEFLSINYAIEKINIKQSKTEARLDEVSKELAKSKKINLIFFVTLLLLTAALFSIGSKAKVSSKKTHKEILTDPIEQFCD